uniref:Uncharacterized protein n=1 Tax=Arundo donax TaxID=35708 RepID=A0A0A9AQC2_ARUDO
MTHATTVTIPTTSRHNADPGCHHAAALHRSSVGRCCPPRPQPGHRSGEAIRPTPASPHTRARPQATSSCPRATAPPLDVPTHQCAVVAATHRHPSPAHRGPTARLAMPPHRCHSPTTPHEGGMCRIHPGATGSGHGGSGSSRSGAAAPAHRPPRLATTPALPSVVVPSLPLDLGASEGCSPAAVFLAAAQASGSSLRRRRGRRRGGGTAARGSVESRPYKRRGGGRIIFAAAVEAPDFIQAILRCSIQG